MITAASSQVEQFEASLAQLERCAGELPESVRRAFSRNASSGWVVRATPGSVKRARFWLLDEAVVTISDLGDSTLVGPAMLSSGPAALAHIADLWIPPPRAAGDAHLPGVALAELFESVRSGAVDLDLGVIGIDREEVRTVVARSAGDLFRASVSASDEQVELRHIGLARLWSDIVALVQA